MGEDGLLLFLNHLLSLVYYFFGLLELLLGFSYLSGKFLANWAITSASTTWQFFIVLSEGIKETLASFVEFEKELLRSILLIYYAIGQIIEAFYITFVDLLSCCSSGAASLGQLAQNTVHLSTQGLLHLSLIPEQILEFLTLLGDFIITLINIVSNGLVISTLEFYKISADILLYFPNLIIKSVLLSPHYVSRGVNSILELNFSFYIGVLSILLIYPLLRTAPQTHRGIVRFLGRGYGSLINLIVRLVRCVVDHILGFILRRSRVDGGISSSEREEFGGDIKGLCVVCHDKPVSFLAAPCNHISLCRDCCYELVKFDNRCPMCRKKVHNYSRVFIS